MRGITAARGPTLVGGFCMLIIAGCRPAADPARERAALLEADLTFEKATGEHGLQGWVGWFAEDGFQVPNWGPLVIGPEAIRANMKGLFGDTTVRLTWAPDTALVAASGDMGYTIGHWQLLRLGAPADSAAARGRYLTVWKKQPDGGWKVAADIGNQEPKNP